MELKYVIIRDPGDVKCCSVSCRTYAEVLALIGIQTKVILLIELNGVLKAFDLSKALVATKISRAYDWEALMAGYMTEQLLEFYAIEPPKVLHYHDNVDGVITSLPLEVPTNKKHALYYSCDKASDIGMGYVSYDTDPTLRDKNSFKWKLKDIVFTQTKTYDRNVDFNNCLPVVNGVIRKPIVHQDELYAMDGTDLLASVGDRNANIGLIDLSPIGNMEVIDFTSCTISNPEEDTVHVTLPADKTLAGKTPMIVLGGRLFFAHEFKQLGQKHLLIDLSKFPLRSILTRNAFLREEFNTLIPTLDIADIQTLILASIIGPSTDAFIVVVDNPEVDILYTPPLYKYTANSFFFPKHSSGILTSIITKDISDYTKLEYDTNELLTLSIPIPGKILPCRQDETGVIAIEYTSDKELKYKDIGEWNMQLINITG